MKNIVFICHIPENEALNFYQTYFSQHRDSKLQRRLTGKSYLTTMCGILGAFSDTPIEGNSFKSSLDLLRSRGPDSEEFLDLETGSRYLSKSPSDLRGSHDVSKIESSKLLGNTRLAITGGDDCQLPFVYKNLKIAYEGELYNYKSIKKQLTNKGHSFVTKGDTEVFIHAFYEWGLETFKRFDGKWAAAIYDENSEKLYCFRDHFGTKPLYYHKKEDRFLFSTMISPLLELKKEGSKADIETSIDFLKRGLVDHKRSTFFQEVKQLRPAEYLVYEDGKVSIGSIPERDKGPTLTDMKDIVSQSIRSKVPEESWATTLSGGLDSSIVACELSDNSPDSYSVDIDNGRFEDPIFSQIVADQEGLSLNEIEVSMKDLMRNVEKSIKEQEEPTNMLPAQAQNILFDKISNDGKKVVLTGSGADELFFGYRHFIPLAIAESFGREGPIKGTKMFLSHLRNLDVHRFIHLVSLAIPERWKRPIRDILKTDSYILDIPDHHESSQDFRSSQNLSDARRSQLSYSWYPAIMRFTDKNAGAHGLETRESFLSQKVYQFLETQEPLENLKNGSTKKTLKDAFQASLPNQILERDDKTGFLPTDNNAFKPELKSFFYEVFKSDSFGSNDLIKQDNVMELLQKGELDFNIAYRLYCYELWKREFIRTDSL